VSCWYSSDDESDAMWRIYSPHRQGIAIRTSRYRLEKIIEPEAYLTDVKYIDFIDERANIYIPSDVFEYKRKAFAYESEVRAIATKYPHSGFENGMPKMSVPVDGEEYPQNGYPIDITLSELIEEIIVSPYSKDWFFDVVIGLVDKYGLSVPVSKSRLKDDPVYARI
jgi:hypothetical protein